MNGEIGQLVGELVRVAKCRRRRTPSVRNRLIYDEVRIDGLTQLAVAAHHGLSQRRVSAICRQVDAWHRQCDAEAGRDLESERRLARRRLEMLYGWSVRGLTRSGDSLNTSVWRHSASGSSVRESINREQRYDVRWLREATKSAERLLELAEREPVGEAVERRGAGLVERVLVVIGRLRQALQREGTAPCLPQIVEQVLRMCEEARAKCSEATASGEHVSLDPSGPAAGATSAAPESCSAAEQVAVGEKAGGEKSSSE